MDEEGPGDGIGRVAQSGVERVERRTPGGVHKHSINLRKSVVACRSCGGPGGGQLFVTLQDFLDENVGAGGRRRERVEIPGRVGQTVRVIHPQAVGQTIGDPTDDLLM